MTDGQAGPASLVIDKLSGEVVAYSYRGETLLTGGTPNFWRGLTDNDAGAGLHKTHSIWKRMTEGRRVAQVELTEDSARIRFVMGPGFVRYEVAYRMLGDGSVSVTSTFTPLKDDLPDPLRIGLRFNAPARLNQIKWYGRGPHESYADRQTGAALGLYEGALADQYHDYIRPQESGNKTDVRWFHLTGASGAGLQVTGKQPLSVNALPFPYEDLYHRAHGERHSSDIVAHGDGSVLIDAIQAGVGGDTGWNLDARPLVKYRVPLKPLSYAFTLKPLDPR